MKRAKPDAAPYIGSVKVGPKGQIVIPKEVREMFGIEPGDALVLLAHPKRGIALERPFLFQKLADAILTGNRDAALHPEEPSGLEAPPEQFAEQLNGVLESLADGEDET